MIRSLRARCRGERGQATVELVGMLPLLLLVAMFVWQLLLVAWTTTSAENAARTASRVEGRGGDGQAAAELSLAKGLRDGVRVEFSGDQAKVRVPVPIVFPGLSLDGLRVTRSAELPPG